VKYEMKFYIEFSSTLVSLEHGYPTFGPPACTVRPAATFVYYMCAIKITQ
jgi:hypothetical protein